MGMIEGTLGLYENAGAPVNGTDEVQTLTFAGAPSSGTFVLSFDGHRTAPLAHNVSAANMQTALRGLPSIGASGVSVGLVGQVYTLTFNGGNMAKLAVPQVVVEVNTTDQTLTPATTTPGVTATGRGAAKGALLIDTTNAKLYINGGTALAPVWKLVTSAA